MTREREIQIRKMYHSKGIHGISIQELRELERKYGVRCSSYSCGGCVYNFLRAIENKKPLSEFMNEE